MTLIRQGDTMIAVESRPAAVAFQDILDATEVVYDEYESMTPWEHCDGFEHTVTEERRYRPDADPDTRKMQGCVYSDGYRERVVIELDPDVGRDTYRYHRERGASRQVAAEMAAVDRRRTLRQLAEWYRNGWEWWGVKCEFEALGETFEDSLWGIDDSDYAEREVKEVALEVAHQLEEAGYTVTGKPDRQAAYNAQRREVQKDRIARNMAAQNWAT